MAVNWLAERGRNVRSQSGEDGILEAIFEVLPVNSSWCVELGAWDGELFSNTWNLIRTHGWSAVLIEADRRRFAQLDKNYADRLNVHCLHRFVTLEGRHNLDATLAQTPLPKHFDLLSIDIDGHDYHLWDSVHSYRPEVVVIEYNPSIPNSISFIQPRDLDVGQGTSLRAMVELGHKKGYELVGITDWNAFFVEAELYPRLRLDNNELEIMRPANPFESQLYQLFDGTLVLDGCRKLIWHDLPIRDEAIQVLPRWFRFFPGQHRNPIRNALQRVWLAILRRI
jgi:hypothetical protein